MCNLVMLVVVGEGEEDGAAGRLEERLAREAGIGVCLVGFIFVLHNSFFTTLISDYLKPNFFL